MEKMKTETRKLIENSNDNSSIRSASADELDKSTAKLTEKSFDVGKKTKNSDLSKMRGEG